MMMVTCSGRSVVQFQLSLSLLSIIACIGHAFQIHNGAPQLPTLQLVAFPIARYDYYVKSGNSNAFPLLRSSSVTLAAKKKRRRRRRTQNDTTAPDDGDVDPENAVSIPDPVSVPNNNELPDFDLETEEEKEEEQRQQRAKRISSNPDEITPAMISTGNTPLRSLDELIMDRSLESKFEFDEPENPSVPDFIQLAQESSSSSSSLVDNSSTVVPDGSMGKKKQRQAERIANAIRLKEEEEKAGANILSNIPMFLDGDGNFRATKVLESGGKYTYDISIDRQALYNIASFLPESLIPCIPIIIISN